MSIFEQLQRRRGQLKKTLQSLTRLTAMSVPQVSNALNGKVDSRVSTVEALADALDASLVLIPKHLLPEVLRILSGKTIGSDDIPSTIDRLLQGERE
jgi:transcriptional regulator with XRE-family HTH domain